MKMLVDLFILTQYKLGDGDIDKTLIGEAQCSLSLGLMFYCLLIIITLNAGYLDKQA